MREFIEANRKQYSLLPPSIEEWLPEDHLARFVVEVVDTLDLSSIYSQYGKKGAPGYSPKMLVAVLFYGYATGVFSSRGLERATYDSVAFRYICGNHHPDHDTIATFRKRFLSQLEGLFVQILLLAQSLGFGKVGQVNIDGTKIQANASKHHAMSYDRIRQLEKQYEEEVKRLMSLAEEADGADQGLDIPAEVARREERLARLRQAKEVLEQRAREQYEEEKQEYDEKMARRKEKQERSGKKPPGRAPKPPDKEVDPKSQYNFTDAESRIMKTKDGFDQCYNAQAAVTNDMLVATTHLSDHPNDKRQLEPVLNAMPEAAGKVESAAADTGYFSEENIKMAHQAGIDPYIATGRQPHNQWLDQQLTPPPTDEEALAQACSAKEQMRHKLRTQKGTQIYRQRKMTVEPVFGIIKEVLGFRRFSLRGMDQAKAEWTLVCTAYNLKRVFKLLKQSHSSVQTNQMDQNMAHKGQKAAQWLAKFTDMLHHALHILLFTSLYHGSVRGYEVRKVVYPTGC